MGGENGELLFNGYRISALQDEKRVMGKKKKEKRSMGIDGGADGCTTM